MGFSELLQMIFALAVIIFLANYLLKKLNNFSHSSNKVIQIIERVPVSKSSSLCVVQIESDYVLMSMSDSGNEILKTFSIEEKEAIQQKLSKKDKQFAEKTSVLGDTLIGNLKNNTWFEKMKGSDKE